MKWMELKKVETQERLKEVAKECGWESASAMEKHLGSSLKGHYLDVNIVECLPAGLKETRIHPIMVIVHGRLFSESCTGLITKDGKCAYIREDVFDRLF